MPIPGGKDGRALLGKGKDGAEDLCHRILSSMLDRVAQHETIGGSLGLTGGREQTFPSHEMPPVAAWLSLDAAVAIWLPPCLQWPGSSELGCMTVVQKF